MKSRKPERFLALVAMLTIIIAGVLGYLKRDDDLEDVLASFLAESELLVVQGEGRYGIVSKEGEKPLSFLALAAAEGYGGEMKAAVRVDSLGRIVDFHVISHGETPSFYKKAIQKGLIQQLKGSSYADSFSPEQGVDVVSGATYTSAAIIQCVKTGSRHVAEKELGLEVPVETATRFSFGIPELTLLLLYLVALVGIYTKFPYKKLLRWTTLVAGLFILGFWFSLPLTLSRINLFLLGFWPDWHDQMYWYILVIGFFLILLVTRKNVYCSWICPLACIQDGLGLVGAARPRFSRRFNYVMRWVQRFIAWLAIVLALYYRNPVQLNYEIFGVSLSLTGATYLFIMTGVFFIASVFIRRPWCNYLCPISPVADFLRMLSGSFKKILFR